MCRLVMALLAISLFGCQCELPRVWVEDAQVIELSADRIESLQTTTDSGTIRVRARDDDQDLIELTATIRVGAASEVEAYDILDSIDIETQLRDAERQQVIGWRITDDRRRSASINVSYELLVPARLGVNARTHNGEIDVAGIQGNCDLESRNGQISLVSEHAELDNDRAIRAATHNGPIRVDAAANDLRLNTHNGEVRVRTTAPRFRFESHNGEIDAQLLAQGPVDGRINTHKGAVRVQLAQGLAAQVKCRADLGNVSAQGLDRFEKVKREHLGQVGSGEGRIEIQTHNGAIDLRRDDARTLTERQEVRATPTARWLLH